MIRTIQRTLLIVLAVMAYAMPAIAQEKPNFLIIVADDLGWSDPGFLGGQIHTPNIDALAKRGAFLPHFYVAPTCSPTRAMLLTGVSNHAAGLGTMHGLQTASQKGHVEYGAQLHGGVVTLAEALRANGYTTSISGKWHLAVDPSQYPGKRGFENSFGLVEGGASHFADARKFHKSEEVTYLENGKPVTLLPDFYSTYAYTDKMIEYIGAAGEQPFFAYLAYTAPHDPLQVPDDWINRYRGKFDNGPADAKDQRARRLIELGLLDEDASLAEPVNFPSFLDTHKKPWSDRSPEEQKNDARRMEIYAAMVEILDQQIGRVVDHLEQSGKLDNTYIIFMSDNGASAGTPYTYPENDRNWVDKNYDLSVEQMGKSGSFTTMGREWANTSNTPFRLYKVSMAEGGVRSPFIISGPGIKPKSVHQTPAHVMDIASSLFHLAGINPAEEKIYQGKLLPKGEILAPILEINGPDNDRMIAAELFGNRMVRYGNWKAVSMGRPLGSGDWELYDITRDPSAMINMAEDRPELLAKMREAYDDFAIQNNVIASDALVNIQTARFFEGPCNSWCQAKFGFVDTLMDARKRNILIAIIFGLLALSGWRLVRRYRARRIDK
jgi:arylsulfatase A-like enzyme